MVSNVKASQRADHSKVVDIYYDLADPNGDVCTITVKASDDAGATWTVPIAALTGAVGGGIVPGSGKHIIWNFGTDLPGVSGTQYRVRVTADDGRAAVPVGMVLIPAGSFQMGDAFNEGGSYERPVHTVYLGAYAIDACEVTNTQYAAALNWAKAQGNQITVTNGVVCKYNSGTGYPYCDTTTSSSYSRITWNGSSFGVVAGKQDHPMVTVSWYGSVAYANWRSAMEGKPLCYNLSTWTCTFGAGGYRLPTEAEWEKAARGGAASHRFPWSDSDYIQHARANYYSSTSHSYDNSPTRGYHPTFATGGYPYTSPVGYFASNGYGLYDMAGNVWEWCNDWYSSSYYSSSPGSTPTGPGSGSCRVLRGGSWSYDANYCRCAHRLNLTPSTRHDGDGFRLALDSP